MPQRIAFMGTPSFAIPALRVIARRFDNVNVLVVTPPDRASGRGRKMQPPPVKVAAQELRLEVLQVATLKDKDARSRLEAFAPDLIVVAAFGLILPKWVLRLPERGCVNLHASELPRFRGASPVAAAIASGDTHAGVALMEMEAGLDTGGVFALETVDIAPSDTSESLTETLGQLGAGLLDRHLDALMAGEMTPIPQAGTVIETRKILKNHGAIDWHQPAETVERHIRAMWSWPRAWAVGTSDVRVQVHAADVLDRSSSDEPGTVVGHDDGVLVTTGDGMLRLTRVQLPGKSAHPASELSHHPAFVIGSQLGVGDDFVVPDPWIVEKGEA